MKDKVQFFPVSITTFCLSAFLFQTFSLTALSSMCFYTCLLLVIIQFIYLCIKKFIDLAGIIRILIIAGFCLTTIILKTPVSKLSFDYLSTFVFLIFLLVSLYNNSIFTCNEKTKCYLAYIIMVVTFIYIFIYILFKNSEKIYWNGNKYYLTFNLTNPNLTGFFLLFLFIYNLMCSFSVGRFLKLISLIFSLSLVFLILQTQARSCLIALLFLVFAVLLFRKYPLNNFIMLLCILIPLIFVMLYMFIIEKGSD